MAPSRAFSPPLPPNATYNHPKLALNILPSAKVFVAGGKLTGSMEVSCSSDRIALGEMALELLGVEELRSPEHTAQTTVHGPVHTVFQGPSRPPSNAVRADAPAIGGHYYPALKGRTRFPFAFGLPSSLPSSLTFASNARVAYTLRGTCQVATIQTGERSLVTRTITVKVVERLADWADAEKKWEETVEARSEAKGEHGGVYAEARLARNLWWPGETSPGQGKVAVEVMVRNNTKRDISGMRLVLARQLSVAPSLSNGAAPTKLVSENIGESTFRGAEYLFPGCGGERTVVAKCPLDVCMPTERDDARVKECFTARGLKLFRVECVVKVAIEMGALSPDLMITLPVTVAQAMSLPPAAHKCFSPPPTTDPGTPLHIDLLPPPQTGLLGLGGSLAGRTSPALGSRPPSPAFSQHAPFAVNGWNCPPSPMASPLPSPRFYPADHPSRGNSPAMPPRQPDEAFGNLSLGPARHQQWAPDSPGPAPYHQLPPPSPAMDPRTRSHSMGAIYQREPYQPPAPVPQQQQPQGQPQPQAQPQAQPQPQPQPQYRPQFSAYQLAHSQSNPHLYGATPSPMMSPYGGAMVESPRMIPVSPVPWAYATAPSPAPTYHGASPVPPPRHHLTLQTPAPPPRVPSAEQRRARHQSMPAPPPPPASSLGVSTGQSRDWNSMPDRPRSARAVPEPEAPISIPRALPSPVGERPASRNSERRSSLPPSPKEPRGPPLAPSSRYSSSSPKTGSPVEDSAEEAIRAAFAAAGIGVPSAALETIGEKGESRAGTTKDIDPRVLVALKAGTSTSGGGRPDGVKIRSVKGVKPRLSEESVEALENIAAQMRPGDAVQRASQPPPVDRSGREPARDEAKPPTPVQRFPSRILRSQSAGLAGLASMLSRSTSVAPPASNDGPSPPASLASAPKSPVPRLGTPTGSTSALRAKSTSISLGGAFVDATPDPNAKRERPVSLASTPKAPLTTWVPPMTRSRTVDVLPADEGPKPEPARRQIASVAPEALLPAASRPTTRPSSIAPASTRSREEDEISKATSRVAEWLKTSDSVDAKLARSTVRNQAPAPIRTEAPLRQLPSPPAMAEGARPRSRLAPTESPLAPSPTQLTRRSCIRRLGSSPNLASCATFAPRGDGRADGESDRIEEELRAALEETNLAMEKATSRRLSTPSIRPPSRLPSPMTSPAPPRSPEVPVRKTDDSIYKSARGGKGGQVMAVAAQWAQRAGEDAPLSEVPRMLNSSTTERSKPSAWELSAAMDHSTPGLGLGLGLAAVRRSEENRRPQPSAGTANGRGGGGLQDLIRRWDSQRDLAAF